MSEWKLLKQVRHTARVDPTEPWRPGKCLPASTVNVQRGQNTEHFPNLLRKDLGCSGHLMQHVLRNTLSPGSHRLGTVLPSGAANPCPPRQPSLELMPEVTPPSVLSSPGNEFPVSPMGVLQMVELVEHSLSWLFSYFSKSPIKCGAHKSKQSSSLNHKLSLHKMGLVAKTEK